MHLSKAKLLRSLSILTTIAGVVVATGLPTRAQTPTSNAQLAPLLQQAASSGSFNTLARLVAAAGVGDTLQEGGEYTILAPTDEAFAQLPSGAVDLLLRPENRDLLRRVLSYHVIPKALTSNEITTGTVATLGGGGIAVRVTPQRIIINNGSVIQPDIQAQNGVVHAISRVLLPSQLRQDLASML